MDDWEKFIKTLPGKEDFYSLLIMEYITDPKNLQRFWNKTLRRISDYYVQNNTLLLADVFENLQNMCLKLYELYPAKFFPAPWLAWQATCKKAKVN